MSEAYELLFTTKTQGEETLVKLYGSIRDIDTAGKGASQSVDGIGASMGRAAAPTSQLSAELRAAVAAINQNTSSLESLTTALEGVTTTAPRAGESIRGVGRDAMYASAALRELDGSMGMRSAGRFLTDMLGLGPVLRAIFPVVGAIAFGEILFSIGEKIHNLFEEYDPLAKAQKESLEIIRETGREYEQLIKKANRLRLEEYERVHGKEARQGLEASELEAKAHTPGHGDQDLIDRLKKEIRENQGVIEYARGVAATPGVGDTGALDESARVAEAKLVGLRDQLRNAEQIQSNDAGEASLNRAKIADEEKKKRVEAAKKALAEIVSAEKSAATALREAQTHNLDGLQKIFEKYKELIALNGKSGQSIQDYTHARNLNLIGEAGKESSKYFTDAQGDDEKSRTETQKLKNNEFLKQLRVSIAAEEKEIKELEAAADRYDKSDANAVKREADKALRISDLSAGNGSGAQGIANNNAYQIRLDLAKQLFDIEARRIDRLDDEGEKEKALAQARLDYEDELDKARTDHEIKFLELQKKDLDEVHSLAASFYDAIRRGGTGLQQFFSSQGQGIARSLFSNAATEGYKAIGAPTLGGLIPGQTGADGQLTTIGRILQGTPFGVNAKDSAQKNNTSALTRLTSSVDRLAARISGRAVSSDSTGSGEAGIESSGFPPGSPDNSSGEVAQANSLINALGNTSVPGMVGVSFSDLGTMTQAALATTAGTDTGSAAGTVANGNSMLAALTGTSGYGGFVGSLARFAQPGQGPGAIMDAITGDSGDSGAQRAGVLVGAGTAAATGVMGVIQGVEQGGARGTLSAVAAGAGTVAAFDPDPVSKSIIAGVASAAGLIKGLMGDPRQARALYEERALRDDQYFAPPTISRTTDSSGNEVGYNFMGQAHSLPFNTFSEIMPYDKNYTMPFGSGVPNVWGEVPGQIIEPYTDPQNYKNDYSTPNGTNGGYAPAQTIVNLTVQAIDPQSFANFANKNSATFASMTAKEIKNGHPVGMAIQQAVFGT